MKCPECEKKARMEKCEDCGNIFERNSFNFDHQQVYAGDKHTGHLGQPM